ncbi:DarT1-associated NADAR antitoxin family protein [Rothia nasimurium]|uniref:DarT1-associated NADAR antitoxin family protein n=1 Tax=Rothia nasimurium TaxID=85336 RepID=UPI001F40EFC7|nr:hypothetical protein [Rothia nasimurium]
MAKRPVFSTLKTPPFYTETSVDFDYHPGFSASQKQKSIRSLHNAYSEIDKDSKILEISSKSEEKIGVALSAFNLQVKMPNGNTFSLESVFQSSKVFLNGGPYLDIRSKTPKEAKRDLRLRESGEIIGFEFHGRKFPLEPKTFFYDWLYINTLIQHPHLHDSLAKYTAFTDIEFNPKKSINCQARSAAIFVSLLHQGLISDKPITRDKFNTLVYGEINSRTFDENALF